MANREWCRWYRPKVIYPTCEKDIDYDSVMDCSIRPYRWPCTSPAVRGLCSSFEGFTPEEIEQTEQEVAAIITRLADFQARRIDTCIHCGRPVAQLEQIGRCVYARPCGCRLWQGTVPKEWQT